MKYHFYDNGRVGDKRCYIEFLWFPERIGEKWRWGWCNRNQTYFGRKFVHRYTGEEIVNFGWWDEGEE